MPKMKTVKSVMSKFRVTGTGKLKRNKPGKRHLLSCKSSKRKRQLRSPAIVGPSHEKTYRGMMAV